MTVDDDDDDDDDVYENHVIWAGKR
jgi:hypothetical protein